MSGIKWLKSLKEVLLITLFQICFIHWVDSNINFYRLFPKLTKNPLFNFYGNRSVDFMVKNSGY